MSSTNREAIKTVIRDARRCDRFFADDPCDGLGGCDRCLELAAAAVERLVKGAA